MKEQNEIKALHQILFTNVLESLNQETFRRIYPIIYPVANPIQQPGNSIERVLDEETN